MALVMAPKCCDGRGRGDSRSGSGSRSRSQWRLFMVRLVMGRILTAYMHAVRPSELDVRVYSITHEAGGVRIVAVDWKQEVAWLI